MTCCTGFVYGSSRWRPSWATSERRAERWASTLDLYRWKQQLDRHGPEILRPRERRVPRMADATSPLIEQRVVAFALGHPGFGPARIAAELAHPAGAPSGCRPMASGGCWVAMAFRPGPSAMGWWLGTLRRQPLSGRHRHPSGTWTWSIPGSWSSWTDQAQPLGPLDQPACPTGRCRPGRPRLEAGASHERQRL
jgi:hypothetical protein